LEMDQFSNKIRQESFRMFYQKHSKGFWFFIFKTCGDSHLADDIFQESFFKFLKFAPRELNEFQQKAYLYKIAFRLVMDEKRKAKNFDNTDTETLGDNLDGREVKSSMLSLDMEKIFVQLKPGERILLWLAYVEGYSHKEIAEITGKKEKSVKVVLFRTRKKFSGLLHQRGYEGGTL